MERIRFDDNATADRVKYQEAWKASPKSGREWNVGFIRSPNREDLNTYGSTLEDLFGIIRTEPEVKRCLVKRMFEYYVSEKQVVDAGYLEQLAARFVTQAKSNSSRAFKATTKAILLSRSFREQDPISDQCYDFPDGYSPAGRPPCKVAHVFDKNCASCHYDTFEPPYLDLSSWQVLPDGSYNFLHLDADGNQLPTKVTFERLNERLTTVDPKKRMPLRRHMDALDREVLFKWVNDILSGN